MLLAKYWIMKKILIVLLVIGLIVLHFYLKLHWIDYYMFLDYSSDVLAVTWYGIGIILSVIFGFGGIGGSIYTLYRLVKAWKYASNFCRFGYLCLSMFLNLLAYASFQYSYENSWRGHIQIYRIYEINNNIESDY